MVNLYRRSVFCLQPAGDDVSRKGVVDALLLGCIPVLFYIGTATQWPAHWGSWVGDATVYFDYADVLANRTSVIEELASISRERIQAMQSTISKHGHRLAYAAVDTDLLPRGVLPEDDPVDAFDILLEVAAAHARNATEQAAGAMLQRTRGRHVQAAIDDWSAARRNGSALPGKCPVAQGNFRYSMCRRTDARANFTEAPWPSTPSVFVREETLAGCVERCRRCERCQFASFSMMARLCAWADAATCNTTRLYAKHEFWAYRTVQMLDQFAHVTDHKTGAFQDWTEDHEVVDITLPIPAGTTKKQLVCKITSDSLHVRHLGSDTTLLRAEPLGGPIDAEESTWYLQGDLLCLQLAKQWRGANKSDQYWGSTLAAKGGTFECHMKPSDVMKLTKERQRKEEEKEKERRERIRASEKELRERGPPPPKVEKRIHDSIAGSDAPKRPSQRELMKEMWREKQEAEFGGSGVHFMLQKFATTMMTDKKFALTLLVAFGAFVWTYLPNRTQVTSAIFGAPEAAASTGDDMTDGF